MTDPRELESRLQALIGGQYRIVRELGGGGMSRVFLADEVELDRQVVIKVLPPEMAAGVSVDRFRREILLAASLQHPHVVPLLSAGASGDLLYYVMPYIDGESLRQKLEREGELPIGEVVRILREVVDALEYAHSRGIVHRDIKPENVMLARKHALVTDFGVAKAVAESGKHSLTSMGVALGTPTYMAPEQASADPHTDHRADIYAVGVMAYEMLCGRPPFVGNNPQSVLAAHVTQAPDPIATHRQTVPEGLQAIIMRCLEKRAADRWQSADDLAPALEGYAVSSGGITPTGTRPVEAVAARPTRTAARPMRVAILFSLAAVAVLALVFAAIQWMGLPDWVMLAAGVLLAAGLPIMLLTGHVEQKRVTTQTPSAGRAGWRRLFTWKRAVLGGVAAFAVLALAVGGYMAMRSLGIGPVGTLMASGAISDRDKLVLADFTNRTSDSTLARSVTEALRIDLAQSPVIRLLDPADISAALTRMQRNTDSPMDLALAREVAEREGAKAIVTGEISPVGQGYVLSATILSSEDGSVLVAQRETAENPGALIAAIDRLSGKLRERIGESLKSIRDAEPLEDVSTASLEALERYTQAIRLEAAGNAPAAIGLLEEATSIDTAFAMAWRKLAVIRSNSASSQEAVVDAATRAFVHRERLPRKERYLAEGYYYSAVDHQPERVITAYRSLLDIDPENNTALNNLSLVYSDRREFATAESLLTRAAAVDNHWTGYSNLMLSKLALGKVEEARDVLDRYAAIAPGSDPLIRMRMSLAAWQDNGDSAEMFARELGASDDPGLRFIAGYNRVARAQLHGRLKEADDQLRQVMAGEVARDNPQMYIGASVDRAMLRLRLLNDTATARRYVAEALVRYPVESLPPANRPYVPLARFYTMIGDTVRSVALLREYSRAVPEGLRRANPALPSAEADLAMARGRPLEAVQLYRERTDINCFFCDEAAVARAWEAAGERDSAAAVLEELVQRRDPLWYINNRQTLAPAHRWLGGYYEDRDPEKALEHYRNFLDLWSSADPALLPQINDVKSRVARLSSER